MVFKGSGPLFLTEMEIPKPAAAEVLIKVEACGVCRTDLHLVDGDLPKSKLPVIPGHEIVGRIESIGSTASRESMLKVGQRVGVPWLASTCAHCRFCLTARENLCDSPEFTGYTKDGGFAQYTLADYRFAFALPDDIGMSAEDFSPMLCAGLIGWRSLRFALPALQLGEGRLGIYGFGAAGHIITQVALQMGYEVYAFVRKGDNQAEKFALSLGAAYAGPSDQVAPQLLDSAIIFAPSGDLVPSALKSLRRGGSLVLGGIHMSDLPSMPYDILWGERTIQSVANLTRPDGDEFIEYLAGHKVKTSTTVLPLSQANQALDMLRQGKVSGALVLRP